MTKSEYITRCRSMRIMSERYPTADKVPERLRHEAVVLMNWAPHFGDFRDSKTIIGHNHESVRRWRHRYGQRAS